MSEKINPPNPIIPIVLLIATVLVGTTVYSRFQSSPEVESLEQSTSELDESIAAICESKADPQAKEDCFQRHSK